MDGDDDVPFEVGVPRAESVCEDGVDRLDGVRGVDAELDDLDVDEEEVVLVLALGDKLFKLFQIRSSVEDDERGGVASPSLRRLANSLSPSRRRKNLSRTSSSSVDPRDDVPGSLRVVDRDNLWFLGLGLAWDDNVRERSLVDGGPSGQKRSRSSSSCASPKLLYPFKEDLTGHSVSKSSSSNGSS